MKRWAEPSSTSHGRNCGGSLFHRSEVNPTTLPLAKSRKDFVHMRINNRTSTIGLLCCLSTTGTLSSWPTLLAHPGFTTIPSVLTLFLLHAHVVAIGDWMLAFPLLQTPPKGPQCCQEPPTQILRSPRRDQTHPYQLSTTTPMTLWIVGRATKIATTTYRQMTPGTRTRLMMINT